MTGSIEDLIVAEVAERGYHPRTSLHSDTQSTEIIRELISSCPLIRKRAASGELVAKLRHHQQVGHADWVIDIALGTPAGPPLPPEPDKPIRWTEPALIQIAVELKSIWTEHGKARRNRLRDFNAFHTYAHAYDPRVVASAFLVVNAADVFLSPLNVGRRGGAMTRHRRPSKPTTQLVRETIDLFRSVHLRTSADDGPGLEALGVVVVEHDNINFLRDKPELSDLLAEYGPAARPTRVAPSPPALKIGDPLHYAAMIQRICNAYTARFS